LQKDSFVNWKLLSSDVIKLKLKKFLLILYVTCACGSLYSYKRAFTRVQRHFSRHVKILLLDGINRLTFSILEVPVANNTFFFKF